jgi:CRP-like cAMP-binding protein
LGHDSRYLFEDHKHHYYAETAVTVHFLPLDAIEELKASNPKAVIALNQLVASLLSQMLGQKKTQVSRLLNAIYFDARQHSS